MANEFLKRALAQLQYDALVKKAASEDILQKYAMRVVAQLQYDEFRKQAAAQDTMQKYAMNIAALKARAKKLKSAGHVTVDSILDKRFGTFNEAFGNSHREVQEVIAQIRKAVAAGQMPKMEGSSAVRKVGWAARLKNKSLGEHLDTVHAQAVRHSPHLLEPVNMASSPGAAPLGKEKNRVLEMLSRMGGDFSVLSELL